MYLIIGTAVLQLVMYAEEKLALSEMYSLGVLCVALLASAYMGWHSLLLNTTLHRVGYIVGCGLMLDHLTRYASIYEEIFLSEGVAAKAIVAAGYAGIPTALIVMPVAVMMPMIIDKAREYTR